MQFNIPAVRYSQGDRQMFATAMTPGAVLRMVVPPEKWNPLGGNAQGNRPRDPKHQAGIARYLREEGNPVLGAVVLYARPRDVEFRVDENQNADPGGSVTYGHLFLAVDASLQIGDGQHRLFAIHDLLVEHSDSDDPVRQKLERFGVPVLLVVDDNGRRMAQDFVDLQRNVKPPTKSLGHSMDRRQAINRLLLRLCEDEEVVLLHNEDGKGERIEFLKDSPGKLSAKIMSYQTLRYMVGTLLVGTTQRSTAAWERKVNEAVGDPLDETIYSAVKDFLIALGESIPPYRSIINGARVADVRSSTYALSGTVMYAIALACHNKANETGATYADVARSLGAVLDLSREQRLPTETRPLTEADTILAGTLVDPLTAKMVAGRAAWEAAAKRFEKLVDVSGTVRVA